MNLSHAISFLLIQSVYLDVLNRMLEKKTDQLPSKGCFILLMQSKQIIVAEKLNAFTTN